jgi:hypothetical protein
VLFFLLTARRASSLGKGFFSLIFLSLCIVGCSGGVDFQPGASGESVSTSIISASVTDLRGVVVSDNVIGPGTGYYVQARLSSNAGVPLVNQLVKFTADPVYAGFIPDTTVTSLVTTTSTLTATFSVTEAKTDEFGIARAQIVGRSSGASGVKVEAVVGKQSLTTTLNFSTYPKVQLSLFKTESASIQELRSTRASVLVSVNGQPVSAAQALVSFSAPCGSFVPSTVTTSFTGVAQTTYTATSGCVGSFDLRAAVGNNFPITTRIAVLNSLPAAVSFVEALPVSLVISTTPTGVKQSSVKFLITNAASVPMFDQEVVMELDALALTAGVRFLDGGVLVNGPVTVNSDTSGVARATVVAGTLPTAFTVKASLKSDSLIYAISSGLTVTTGRISQRFVSLISSSSNVESNGAPVEMTMQVADRLGSPVPAGLGVSFLASHGLISSIPVGSSTTQVTGSCTLDATSSCKMRWRAQGSRPSNGTVTVLGYVEGEEAFSDSNGNNVWDIGESFVDIGEIFLDVNGDGVFTAGVDQSIPGGATGSAVCSGSNNARPNTCDGTWSNNIRVRASAQIYWAGSNAVISKTALTANQLTFGLSDTSGGNMPAASKIEVDALNAGVTGCSITVVNPAVVPQGSSPVSYQAVTNGAAACATSSYKVTVTTPAGVVTIGVLN